MNGNDEYKAVCIGLAAKHEFKITNPELKERIAAKIEENKKIQTHDISNQKGIER